MTRHGRVWGFAGSAGQRPGLGSLVAAATLGGMLLAGAQAALAAPVWVPTDKLAQPRANAVGILLQNGRVLAIGGSPTSQDTAELYDPTTGVWSAADVLGAGRQLFSAVLLRDGRVLVCGGRDKNPTILAACQAYDPVTEKWSNVAPMRVPREDFTLTLLDDGTVLAAGGITPSGRATDETETYDPPADKWTDAGLMNVPRARHAASRARDGVVLVSGGVDDSFVSLRASETYNEATRTWTPRGNMLTPRADHSLTLLPDGLVLAVGGNADGTAERYNGGTWGSAAGLPGGGLRVAHTATMLPNGDVLVAGGSDGTGSVALAATYRYSNNQWTSENPMGDKRSRHMATLLPDGRVLVAGGFDTTPTELQTAELFDAAGPTLVGTGNMGAVRSNATATLLKDGRVLVVGGLNGGGAPQATAETYDASGGTATATAGPMSVPREGHTATQLVNGQVLIAGGVGAGSSTELYDPSGNKFNTTGSLAGGRWEHTASLLECGEVLVTGGQNGAPTVPFSSSERYNPRTKQWLSAKPMNTARRLHTATLLKDGRVLVVGGTDGVSGLASAEVYNPVSDSWSAAGNLQQARIGHRATLLANGKVLIVGGTTPAASTAEVFDPASGTSAFTGPLGVPRDGGFVAKLLANGHVFVAGGLTGGNSSALFDATTGTWTSGPGTVVTRRDSVVSLLLDGRLLMAGGVGTATAERYDSGRGDLPGWRPSILAITDPLLVGDRLALTGGVSPDFQGMGEASSGAGARQASTAYPLVQLRRLDNDLMAFLPVDPSTGWDKIKFTSLPVGGFAPGIAIATVFVNGIPGASKGLTIESQPAFLSPQPNPNQVICPGSPATLTVGVPGNLCPGYQWRLGGTALSDGAVYAGTTTKTLNIAAVNGPEAGTYTVDVSPSCSSQTTPSNAAVISLDTPLSNVTASMPSGTTACTTCTGGTATEGHTGGGGGGTSVTYQWGYRTVSGVGVPTTLTGRTASTYVLTGADFPGAGTYYLVVTTSPACGAQLVSNEIPITITGGSPSEDVRHLTVTSRDSENVLEWVNPPGAATVNVRFVGGGPTCSIYPVLETDGAGITGYPKAVSGGEHELVRHTGLVNGTAEYCYTVFRTGGTGRTNKGRPFSTSEAPLKWTFRIGGFSTTPPTVGTAGVIALSNDLVVHAMQRGSGATSGEWPANWQPFPVGGVIQGRSPVVPITVGGSNPVVYLGDQSGRVYAMDGNKGGAVPPAWTASGFVDIQGAPAGMFTAFGGAFDYVFVGTRGGADDQFVALDPQTGTVKGTFNNGGGATAIGRINGTATVDYATKRAFFGSQAGGSPDTLWALDLAASPVFTKAWSVALGTSITSSPVLRGGHVYVGSNAGGGTLHAVNATDGTEAAAAFVHGDGEVKGFVFPDRLSLTADLAFSTDNRVWVVSDNGTALVARSGFEAGVVLGSGAKPSALLLIHGLSSADSEHVYVGADDGNLYEIEVTGTGPVVKSYPLFGSSTVGAPSFDRENNLIHVGSEAGVFYAVQVPLP